MKFQNEIHFGLEEDQYEAFCKQMIRKCAAPPLLFDIEDFAGISCTDLVHYSVVSVVVTHTGRHFSIDSVRHSRAFYNAETRGA